MQCCSEKPCFRVKKQRFSFHCISNKVNIEETNAILVVLLACETVKERGRKIVHLWLSHCGLSYFFSFPNAFHNRFSGAGHHKQTAGEPGAFGDPVADRVVEGLPSERGSVLFHLELQARLDMYWKCTDKTAKGGEIVMVQQHNTARVTLRNVINVQ